MHENTLKNLRRNIEALRSRSVNELKMKGEFSTVSMTSIVTQQVTHYVVFTPYDKPNEFIKIKQFNEPGTSQIIAENFNEMLKEFE